MLGTYEEILKIYEELEVIRTKQKLRGVNDFNIFTVLLKNHEEVRLHSRFIASLLDPHGLHYQGTLFLEKFLSLLGWGGFLDAEKAAVHVEYKNIDIYLTDGENHIILENKVYAGDQDRQIKRYIEIIFAENQDVISYENIKVLYLTLDRTEPSDESLGSTDDDGYILHEDGYLQKNTNKEDERIGFASLNYHNPKQNDILKWIDDCLHDVYNITNISFGLKQYRDVILELYNVNNGGVMTLEEYLKNRSDVLDIVKNIENLSKELETLKKDVMTKFWNDFTSMLSESMQVFEEDWVLEKNDLKRLIEGTHWKAPLHIRSKTSKEVILGMQYRKPNFGELTVGVLRNPYVSKVIDMNHQDILANTIIADALKNIPPELKDTCKPENYWLCKYTLCKSNFFEQVFGIKTNEKEEFDEYTKSCVEFVMKILNHFKEALVEANTIVAQHKVKN